jgi:hypothetical protein
MVFSPHIPDNRKIAMPSIPSPTRCAFFGLQLALCLSFTSASYAAPDDGKLSGHDRQAPRDTSKFHEIHATRDLPRAVLDLFPAERGGLAEPGADWQATDVVMQGSHLPTKRLIWAVAGPDSCVVHFESGGIAHMFHIRVISLKNGKVDRVTETDVRKPFASYKEYAGGL